MPATATTTLPARVWCAPAAPTATVTKPIPCVSGALLVCTPWPLEPPPVVHACPVLLAPTVTPAPPCAPLVLPDHTPRSCPLAAPCAHRASTPTSACPALCAPEVRLVVKVLARAKLADLTNSRPPAQTPAARARAKASTSHLFCPFQDFSVWIML